VLRHARDIRENSLRRVDYLAYFNRDPRIAEALRQFRLAERVGEYLLYVRAASPDQPGQPPRSEPGRYDVLRPEVSDGWQALAADRRFLRDVGIYLLLALGAYIRERRRASQTAPQAGRSGQG
jgi:hypothetical protein